jgi:hypothetical protein
MTGTITPRPLTISATGVNKIYDGSTTATVTLSDNRISGDVFTDSYTSASFETKSVGDAKPVSVSGISISGTDAINYTFNTTATTTANITPRPLTVTATGVDKVYDGTIIATVTLSDNRISGDAFTASYTSANFADPNVGTAKPILVSGISISGTDAGNYTVNATAAAAADITKATPLFSDLSSPTIPAGQATTTISGKISASGIFPAGNVTISVVSAGTQSAAITARTAASPRTSPPEVWQPDPTRSHIATAVTRTSSPRPTVLEPWLLKVPPPAT